MLLKKNVEHANKACSTSSTNVGVKGFEPSTTRPPDVYSEFVINSMSDCYVLISKLVYTVVYTGLQNVIG